MPELHHALACYERAGEFDVVNDHSGLPAAALGGAISTPVVHTVHGPLDGSRADLRADRSGLPSRRARLVVAEPAPSQARSPVGRQLSERARPRRLSRQPSPRRLSPVPRAALRGQGRAPGDRGRQEGRVAAEDRREDARAARARSTSRRACGRTSAGGWNTSARCPTTRRSTSSERPRHAVPDRVGGAVRARHDRVDGLRHAGGRHPFRRGARGDRARHERPDRR